jgi:dTDP-4-amino-4,6-dideoxygalactose transaminase
MPDGSGHSMSDDMVPFLDLKRTYESIRTELKAAVEAVLDGQRFVLGPEGEALERECAALVGAPAAVGVASGTDALIMTYRALELGSGDEVVTSPFSFFASAGAVVNAGGRPVFADIDPVTFNLDPRAAAAAIGPRTRVICPVHLFGQAAEVVKLRELVGREDLVILEDAAQAIGATLHGVGAGALGDAAAFSFYPTKNLGGAGDGGLVTAVRRDLADRVRLLRHHGQTGPYEHAYIGTNSRLDEIQAAILRVKLRHLPDWNEARRELARGLSERLRAGGLQVKEGGHLEGADLSLPAEAPGCRHVYNLYTIRARQRDALQAFLKERGIGCGVYYPLPLHLQPCFEFLGDRQGRFPEAELACREVLALPLYPGLTDAEQDRIAGTVRAFYEGKGVR